MGKRGDSIENCQRCGCTDYQLGQSLRYPTGIRRIQRWLGISWLIYKVVICGYDRNV